MVIDPEKITVRVVSLSLEFSPLLPAKLATWYLSGLGEISLRISLS